MTTAADLIAFLNKLPPNTRVRVMQEKCRGFQIWAEWVDLKLPEGDPEKYDTETCNFWNGDRLDLGGS